MRLWRFYCCPITNGINELPDAQARHLGGVLRQGVGRQIELFDGRGTLAQGVISEISPRRVIVDVQKITHHAPPAGPEIILIAGIIKGTRFDDLIEHAAELGVDRLYPTLFERTVKTAGGEQVRSRWHNIAIAACKQSGCLFLPHIADPARLDDHLAALQPQNTPGAYLYGQLEGSPPNILHHPLSGQKWIWCVGPEGGLTEAEEAALTRAGFIGVSLTPTILRAETAALTGAAILCLRRQS